MTKKLLGAPVVQELEQKTKDIIAKYHISGYLAVFMLGENHPGVTYVRKKQEYAEKLGLTTKVYTSVDTIDADIHQCNNDSQCLGILIQLPLPDSLATRKQELLDMVHPAKDVDCLGNGLLHQIGIYGGHINIAPATPSAVMHLLTYYNFHYAINGHQIAVIGESDLIGKPLAKILAHLGGYVHTFNEHSNQRRMRSICKESDIIIAATGKLHLVDEEFIKPDQSQVLIDVGRGLIDGKPAGDINQEKVEGKISAITPVPGGVGPVTVASLFWNLVMLYIQRDNITVVS